MPIPLLFKPELVFDLTMKATKENAMILMDKYNGSLLDALDGNKKSIMGLGSEFWQIKALSSIINRHPV